MICLASLTDEFGSWVENELKRDKVPTAAIWRRHDGGLGWGHDSGQGEVDMDRSYIFSAKPTVSALN